MVKTEEALKICRTDIRCPRCQRLILKAVLWGAYSIEFVCPRCKCKTQFTRIKEKKNVKSI